MLRRIPPLFPPQIWNVHQVTHDGEYRANNLCEAWNHRIEHLCGVSHSSVWKLIHGQMLPQSIQLYSTMLVVSFLAIVSNVCTSSYSLIFINYLWIDEMAARLLKNSFNELVTTSAKNLMVE
ncbi:hypothetical protein LSH36_1111g01006 [Paralvinella palmiformis]|uniref:Uncharacterized protein n=1 Tax=Paralvinella palmiformis TaxID=53620 RepID=A0AAD9IWI8_9ANNE|nr:hypothetical protein LSH36_1111g01006 [Paralvinella palmiformis]